LISNDLGIVPTDSYRKGDAFGKKVIHHRRRGHWGISSEDAIESWEVDDHVTWLMRQMSGKTEIMQRLRSLGYEIAVRVCWVDRGGTGGPSISPENIVGLGTLGARLNIDWYPADPADRFPDQAE
jgi:hypothetical protein